MSRENMNAALQQKQDGEENLINPEATAANEVAHQDQESPSVAGGLDAVQSVEGANKFNSAIDEVAKVESLNPFARYAKYMDLLQGRHEAERAGLEGAELAKKLVEQNEERGAAITEVLKLEWNEAVESTKAALQKVAQGIGWGFRQALGLVPKVMKGVAKTAEIGAKGTALVAAGVAVAGTSPVWATVGAVETASMVVRNQFDASKVSKSDIPGFGKLIDGAAAKINAGIDNLLQGAADKVAKLAQGVADARLTTRRAKAEAALAEAANAAPEKQEAVEDLKSLVADQKAADEIMDAAPDAPAEVLRDVQDQDSGPEIVEDNEDLEAFENVAHDAAKIYDLFLQLKRFDQSADPVMFEHLKGNFHDLTDEEYTPEFSVEEWIKDVLETEMGKEPSTEDIKMVMALRDEELEDEDRFPGYQQREKEEQELIASR